MTYDDVGPALTTEAHRTAEVLLRDDLPRRGADRWAHVQRVAATAYELAAGLAEHGVLDQRAVDLAVSAAWLHDLGYAPALVVTGFHPLDGAVWLREQGWSWEVTGLVAHHSLAVNEAARRGLGGELREFVDVPCLVRDVLWVADATSGPAGEVVTIDARLADVVDRYGPDHLVSECMVLVAVAASDAQRRIDLATAAAAAVSGKVTGDRPRAPGSLGSGCGG